MENNLRQSKISFQDYPIFGFFLVNLLIIRFTEIKIGSTNLLYIEPIFLILIFIFLANFLVFRLKINFSPYFFQLGLFLIYGIISAFLSYNLFENEAASIFGKFRQICIYPFILIIAFNITTPDLVKIIDKLFKYSILLYVPLTLILLTAGIDVFERHGYFQLFYNWEGWIASYYIYKIIFGSLLKKKQSVFEIFIALVALIIVIFTARRGLWLSIGLASIILYFFSSTKISIKKALKPIFITLTLIILLFVSASKFDFISNSIEEQTIITRFDDMLENLTDPTNINTGGTAYLRMIRYYTGLDYFYENPILGKGIGFKTLFQVPAYGSWVYEQSLFHNSYLEVLVSMGLIGLILFLFIHLKFVKAIFKYRKKIGDDESIVILSLFGIYIAGMLWSLIDNTFVSNSNFIFTIYFLIGLVSRYLYYKTTIL